ncbi:DUF1906 domain-containing protein [Streptomyces sp. NPDC006475]|uniref:DUF1906 domain-containing protein n=1 Tax=Streptomyces sp. NPDC006475 TaxID=3155719 RepID=UPI0033BCE160
MRLRKCAAAVALALTALLGLLLAPEPERSAPRDTAYAAAVDAPAAPDALVARPPTDRRADADADTNTKAERNTNAEWNTKAQPNSNADAPAEGSGAVVDTTADTALTFRGLAFDTCQAPPLAAMRSWRTSSPYGAVGVSYGGRGRRCLQQPHLTRDWVAAVHRMGWQVLPVFAGSQSPCVRDERRRAAVIGASPGAEGQREGNEAVERAWALGMARGSALYLDLEAYDVDDVECARATLDFVRAWNREVRRRGYVPGFHSTADAGVLHMERARLAGTGDLPSAMWFARRSAEPALYEDLYDEQVLNPYAWRPKRRIHQYDGDVTESHGGHSLTVGRSMADAPVARIRP